MNGSIERTADGKAISNYIDDGILSDRSPAATNATRAARRVIISDCETRVSLSGEIAGEVECDVCAGIDCSAGAAYSTVLVENLNV